MLTTPQTLGPEGRALWKWTTSHFEVAGCEPLLTELCSIADRLAEIRSAMKGTKLDTRLVNAEVKLMGQFQRAWKLLGLADSEQPRRRVGRPAGVSAKRIA